VARLSPAGVGAQPFVENWMSANRFAHCARVARIGKPVDRDEWRISPHIVNAFYNAANNEIVFPAAILQPPFFDAKADDAVNYGGIGMVIGHEITHGFDDRGRRFDKDGNLRDWWSEEDSRRYNRPREEGRGPVRRLLGRRRHQGERRAHPGREHLGHRRLENRVPRAAEGPRGQAPGEDRWLHAPTSASSCRSPRSGVA
jgi:hypothetical protein